jgi:hypothetical protein
MAVRKFYFQIRVAALLVVLSVTGAFAGQVQGEREYVGAMGNSLRIRMTLNIEGRSVQGSYVYEAVGKPLALTGTISGKQITLRETDEDGKHTGTFKGQFVTATLIEGNWSNPAGTKTLPFSVKAIAGSSATSPASAASDGVSGQYQRVDATGRIQKVSGSTLNVQLQGASVKVQGQAFLVINAQTGNVRTGEVAGTFRLSGHVVRVKGDDDYSCAMTLTFGKGTLDVSGDNGQCGGLSVSFNGSYRRVGPAKFD